MTPNSIKLLSFPFFSAQFLSIAHKLSTCLVLKRGAKMNAIMQQLVNQKVNSLSSQDLLQLATQYNISLSPKQADQVIAILRSEQINVADQAQIQRILQRLQTEVDSHVSSVIQQLLQQFSQYL